YSAGVEAGPDGPPPSRRPLAARVFLVDPGRGGGFLPGHGRRRLRFLLAGRRPGGALGMAAADWRASALGAIVCWRRGLVPVGGALLSFCATRSGLSCAAARRWILRLGGR